jgi:hypothetical protein
LEKGWVGREQKGTTTKEREWNITKHKTCEPDTDSLTEAKGARGG